ncbi:MAG: rhodanese-like domain-containing protein [Lysobacteraceae bacterium]
MFFERLPEFIANHPILSLAFVGIAVALVFNEVSRFTRGFKAVNPAELTRLINREDALVVDVSPLNDFEKGHIVGSRHVAMSQFDPENKALAKVRELPVAVVCRSGVTSAQAAKRLVKAGFSRVYSLEGGVAAWQQADLPLARGKAKG